MLSNISFQFAGSPSLDVLAIATTDQHECTRTLFPVIKLLTSPLRHLSCTVSLVLHAAGHHAISPHITAAPIPFHPIILSKSLFPPSALLLDPVPFP